MGIQQQPSATGHERQVGAILAANPVMYWALGDPVSHPAELLVSHEGWRSDDLGSEELSPFQAFGWCWLVWFEQLLVDRSGRGFELGIESMLRCVGPELPLPSPLLPTLWDRLDLAIIEALITKVVMVIQIYPRLVGKGGREVIFQRLLAAHARLGSCLQTSILSRRTLLFPARFPAPGVPGYPSARGTGTRLRFGMGGHEQERTGNDWPPHKKQRTRIYYNI